MEIFPSCFTDAILRNNFLFFSQSDPEDESGYPVVKHGKLSLVDLAGKANKNANQEAVNLASENYFPSILLKCSLGVFSLRMDGKISRFPLHLAIEI